MNCLKNWITIILIVLVLLSSGCSQKITAEKVVEKMKERYESIDSYRAVIHQKEVVNGEVREYNSAVGFKKPNKFFESSANFKSAYDGNYFWSYDRTKDEVRLVKIQSQESPDPFGYVLRELGKYEINLVGEEEIDGKDCYILELTPKKEDFYEFQRIWIVKDELYPIKLQMKVEFKSFKEFEKELELPNVSTSIIKLRNVMFDVEIDDGEFQLGNAIKQAYGNEIVGIALSDERVRKEIENRECRVLKVNKVDGLAYVEISVGRSDKPGLLLHLTVDSEKKEVIYLRKDFREPLIGDSLINTILQSEEIKQKIGEEYNGINYCINKTILEIHVLTPSGAYEVCYDLLHEKVIRIETITPWGKSLKEEKMTEEEKQKYLAMALNDSRVQELLKNEKLDDKKFTANFAKYVLYENGQKIRDPDHVVITLEVDGGGYEIVLSGKRVLSVEKI